MIMIGIGGGIFHLEGLVALVLFFLLAWFKRLPNVEAMTKFMESLNTKGGNLLVLSFFTLVFGITSIRVFLYLLDLSVHHLIDTNNTYALQFIAWVTTSLTIGFIAALLKSMTGDAATPSKPAPDTTAPAAPAAPPTPKQDG